MIYFDHNATTPLLPAARDAWVEAAEKLVGNPSSPHRLGQRADAALLAARETLAGILGCHPTEVIWTSGATESNNLVFHHLAATLPARAEAWVSAIEHPCTLAAAAHHFRGRFRLLPVTPDGVLDLEAFEVRLRRRRPGLVAVMAANNETGVLQPWQEVLALCQRRRVRFFCDAAQWMGKLPARGLGQATYLSGCAHKFGGPRGVGFLKASGPLVPQILGGPQEEGRRAGTESTPAILALVAALQARERSMAGPDLARRLGWRRRFEAELPQVLPGSRVIGADVDRLWNTVAALMPEVDCRSRWVVKLDRAGCAVSTGSACASGKEKPSHVLAAMGCPPSDSGRMLRFSSGWETTAADWKSLLAALQQAKARE